MPTAPSPRLVATGRPIANLLIPFPAVCFTLALLTDVAYWQTANLMWQNFSAWLLFAGIVIGALGLVVGLVELLTRQGVRAASPGWVYVVLGTVVLVLAFVNSLFHAGDGWTAVVPWGLALSAITVILMLAMAVIGRAAVNRRLAGVYHHG